MLCMRMCRYDGGGARDAGGCRHSGSDRSERTHSEALSASKPDHWSAGKQQWHRDHQIPGAVTGLPVSRCTCHSYSFTLKLTSKCTKEPQLLMQSLWVEMYVIIFLCNTMCIFSYFYSARTLSADWATELNVSQIRHASEPTSLACGCGWGFHSGNPWWRTMKGHSYLKLDCRASLWLTLSESTTLRVIEHSSAAGPKAAGWLGVPTDFSGTALLIWDNNEVLAAVCEKNNKQSWGCLGQSSSCLGILDWKVPFFWGCA